MARSLTPDKDNVASRRLNLSIDIDFRPGGKVHPKRMTAIKSAVDKAIAEALEVELPDNTADVSSTAEWLYVWREELSTYIVGPEGDEEL